MFKPTIAILLILSLTGCAGFRATIAEEGGKIYDEALLDAEFVICQAASIGSVRRHYGVSADKADMYRKLCQQETPGKVIGPASP